MTNLVLHHVTTSENLESILVGGLKSLGGRGMTAPDIRNPFIFLTDNPEYIIATQCGQSWVERHKAVVIHIYVDGLDIRSWKISWSELPAPHEWVVAGTITPDRFLAVSDVDHRITDRRPETVRLITRSINRVCV